MKKVKVYYKSVNVGTLSFDGSNFIFEYSSEFKGSNLFPLSDFNDLNKIYLSESLFPIFSARISSKFKDETKKENFIDQLIEHGKKVIHDPFTLAI